jgi:hypothetical protein
LVRASLPVEAVSCLPVPPHPRSTVVHANVVLALRDLRGGVGHGAHRANGAAGDGPAHQDGGERSRYHRSAKGNEDRSAEHLVDVLGDGRLDRAARALKVDVEDLWSERQGDGQQRQPSRDDDQPEADEQSSGQARARCRWAHAPIR